MHYYAKDFFAPIIVTGHLTSSRELDVYVVSDVLTTFYNTTLNIFVYNWSSLQPVFTQRVITDIVRKFFLKQNILFHHFLFSGRTFQENYFQFGLTRIWPHFHNANRIRTVLFISHLWTPIIIL